ncbi:hypothetical protein O181_021355 [Austropuccinia psidii MF-1]|uniref:Uncharacterized protein n=1 Tax=Austropuccinia psidii MF-1 TaxID=1389203 RepID=A0A9Q3CEI1_9BASI|nr:hypothetical protein [Austropuccinia psidii MF-1]
MSKSIVQLISQKRNPRWSDLQLVSKCISLPFDDLNESQWNDQRASLDSSTLVYIGSDRLPFMRKLTLKDH